MLLATLKVLLRKLQKRSRPSTLSKEPRSLLLPCTWPLNVIAFQHLPFDGCLPMGALELLPFSACLVMAVFQLVHGHASTPRPDSCFVVLYNLGFLEIT